ncbi:MAG TPA: FxsA family protein [Solirubrobacteraceae bacterium]|nr:FxsA family protein [Solirubrobacteraceae bacterium]
MFLLALFALFVILPVSEIYVIIQIGHLIGTFWTIVALIADAVIGTWLVRSQGRATWRRFSEALASGRPPARETLDGALVLVGGAFLIAPGFITDIFGAVLVLPPTRAICRRFIVRRFTRGLLGRAGTRARRRRAPGTVPYDVEGTATELDQASLPR